MEPPPHTRAYQWEEGIGTQFRSRVDLGTPSIIQIDSDGEQVFYLGKGKGETKNFSLQPRTDTEGKGGKTHTSKT